MNELRKEESVLILVKKELFEGFEINCYEDQNGDFRITRKQIGEALRYENINSFHKIIQRNKDVIGDPVMDFLSTSDNKQYLTETYTFNQLFQILRFTKQPLANALMRWASLTLEQLIMGKAKLKFEKTEDMFSYKSEINKLKEELVDELKKEINEVKYENKELKEHILEIKNNFIFKQYENPRHRFESAITKYAIHHDLNGSQRYYFLYRDLENWLGIKLPQNKKFTTKEYIISEIGIEIVECFVDGVISGRIVKSNSGNWFDKNGVFNNPVELRKTMDEFGVNVHIANVMVI